MAFMILFSRTQHGHHPGQVAKGGARSRIGREPFTGAVGAFGRAERVLKIFEDLGLENFRDFADFRLLVGGDQRFHLGDVIARHRRQQIMADPFPDRASEPRRMRPQLSCSGAPSTSIGSSGAKKCRDGLATRWFVCPPLRNSARNLSSTGAAPGIDVPQTSMRRLLRACGVNCPRYSPI
jgi:hypothetical protein